MLKPRAATNRIETINGFFIPKLINIRNEDQQEFITKTIKSIRKKSKRSEVLEFPK
jgi:hypothetical protein